MFRTIKRLFYGDPVSRPLVPDIEDQDRPDCTPIEYRPADPQPLPVVDKESPQVDSRQTLQEILAGLSDESRDFARACIILQLFDRTINIDPGVLTSDLLDLVPDSKIGFVKLVLESLR